MRRLFYQTKLYDYSSRAEAVNHIEKMEKSGWKAKRQDDNTSGVWGYIFENGQDTYPYSVEYFKEA